MFMRVLQILLLIAIIMLSYHVAVWVLALLGVVIPFQILIAILVVLGLLAAIRILSGKNLWGP